MEEIFAEFIFAIYDHMHKNEENTVFPFFHMEKIYKNWTRLKLETRVKWIIDWITDKWLIRGLS